MITQAQSPYSTIPHGPHEGKEILVYATDEGGHEYAIVKHSETTISTYYQLLVNYNVISFDNPDFKDTFDILVGGLWPIEMISIGYVNIPRE